jgi:hypothetical protein
MSSSPNPYAAPSAETDFEPLVPGGSESGVYRDGMFLVIPVQGASLPMRCVKCNAPAHTRLKRKLYWHPPGYFLLIFASAIIYVIVAMIVRRRAHFELGLCDRHALRRRTGILLGWLGAGACVMGVFAIGALHLKSPLVPLVLGLGLVACPIIGLVLARVVSAQRIDKQRAWLKVGRPFLESFELGD